MGGVSINQHRSFPLHLGVAVPLGLQLVQVVGDALGHPLEEHGQLVRVARDLGEFVAGGEFGGGVWMG